MDTFVTSGFEAPPGGVPSPPPSPDTTPIGGRPGLKARSRSGDAAHYITEECERLFCETMKAVFLVEKNSGRQNSLVMDVHNISNSSQESNGVDIPQHHDSVMKHGIPTPSTSPDGRDYPKTGGVVKDYVEIWDYVGGARFRGFVAETQDERSLFVFFDKEVIGKDLKPGYSLPNHKRKDVKLTLSVLWHYSSLPATTALDARNS
ncbi:hypothetical protein LTR78_010495 [Recurvomyces mirabilis]|uniref:Uncharacterized protein n=1 Tax=Recurvomyces mirabilis TaxID=574656 RepID=A0AAE0TMS4_9PEZI|nr:hypothetical protein LTR78_010495 [Recurvomyces mirabilis]KAK5151678.1 hypothetical protein LTS14_009165 [Recurvomyces mirabilis]